MANDDSRINPAARVNCIEPLVLSRCRVCGSSKISKLDEVEFYFNYAWSICECYDCGCRFTQHDNSTYDLLYSERSSCYSRYSAQAEVCKALFDRGDRAGLRAALSQGSKYRFIIEAIEREPVDARILEIGSSRGHLSSYLILSGRRITGVDVSPKAVAAARAAFGDHFVLAGDAAVEAQAPYDVIFHVGTVGCVADPIGMTTQLLGLLRPRGRLLFNAPNRNGLTWRNQLWFESAPPPDVVTLFPPDFWRDRFGDVALVSEEIECCAPEQNVLIALRRLARCKWRKPVPIPLSQSERCFTPTASTGDTVWRNVERLVCKVGHWTGVDRFVRPCASEYGLFIQMTKR
jgi:SAM-dependent methyltransferase